MGWTPSLPGIGAQLSLALSGTACNGEEQAHRYVRCAVGQYSRCIGDGNTAFAGSRHVYVAETDPEVGEQPGATAFGRKY